MEKLNRGIVAVSTGGSNVFVSWRWLGYEDNVSFNLYRNGVKINSSPITVCNYTDNAGNTSASYTIKPIINGVEQPSSEATTPWSKLYMTVPLSIPPSGTTSAGEVYTYSPNDCSIGDVDGDGVYEIFVKWDPSNSKDNAHSGYTGNVYIDCYTLLGKRLWRIDLGRNIRAGAHYTQFLVYDFDGDGMAEMACKTADGTKDGKGVVIGNGSADYRNSSGYVLSGPEFLTVFNGKTGAAMATANYTPARGTVSSWGDGYGNRVDRFIAAVAYLDGQRPSMIFGRGYYTRLVRAAWDWRNGQLTQRWIFDSNTSGNGAYAGQGNHQMTVGDVDGDGRQEICNGTSIIDDNGKGLYVNGLGHGDALHMSDMDPDRPGLEVFQAHEEPAKYGNYGLEFRDARTGQPLWGLGGGNQGDIGRAMAADIDPRYKGYECWSFGNLFDCKGNKIGTSNPSVNFAVYWDGDLQRELLDGNKLDKWNYTAGGSQRLATLYQAEYGGGTPCNGTKNTPNLSADLFGDWREEIILHSPDNASLLIYTTTIPSTYSFRTLLHDPQYRMAIAWQNSCYNQPPHLGYYLGTGMNTPAKPNITIVGGTTPPVRATKFIYNYDNSGNYAWENTNSWTPKAVPGANDTVIVRTGEVRIANLNHMGPLFVETNGILRLIDTAAVNDLRLQGGTLKAYTSSPGFVLTSNIKVEAPSTIMAGSVTATIFTLNGTITGSSSLTKTSVGNLRINSNASTFKGNWIVSEGKLQLRSANGLGLCGVQVKSGAVLDIEAASTIYSLVIDSTGKVDLDQSLSTDVLVLGKENVVTGSYTNASRPSYIGGANTLTVKNSILKVSGSTSICTGTNVQLQTLSSSAYSWKNASTQVGTAQTYTANSTGDYTITVTNANSCKVTSATAPVLVNTIPAATITAGGTTTFCSGGSVTLTASAGSVYKWFNGTNQVGANQTYNANTSGDYSVEVTNAGGCKATSAKTTVTVNSAPVATITAGSSTTLCAGESVTLTASPGSSYKWFNGTTQVGNSQTYTANTAGNYTVEVTNANGCKATSIATAVTVNTSATGTITASRSTALCMGESVVLSYSSGASYKWFNGIALVGTGETYTANTAGNYSAEVTSASGCKSTSSPIAITVSSLPAVDITSATPTTLCEGESVTLTSSAGSSYKWFQGSAEVGTSQTFTATATGDYTVEVTNANGCKATSAKTTVTVNSLPIATISAGSSTILCPGESVKLTSNAADSYKWYKGTTLVGTGQAYTAVETGDYAVEVTNASGCKAASSKITVFVLNAPPTTITATSPTTICAGESVALTASTGDSYLWYNGSLEVGTDQIYVATTPGDYKVEVTNSNGCVGVSSVTKVEVNAASIPIITPAGPTDLCVGESVLLTTGIESSYKWYQGAIEVGTSETLTASESGEYKVEITNSNGCVAISDEVIVKVSNCVPTSVGAGQGGNLTAIFPNPFSGETGIQQQGKFVYRIYDSRGCLVDNGEGEDIVNIGSGLAKGLYLLHIEHRQGSTTFKIVKE